MTWTTFLYSQDLSNRKTTVPKLYEVFESKM